MLTLGCQVMLTNEGTVPFPGFPQLFEYSFSQIWALNSFKESFGDRKKHGCPCSPTILPFGGTSLAVARGTEVLTTSPEPRVPAQDAGGYRQCRFLFHPQSPQAPDLRLTRQHPACSRGSLQAGAHIQADFKHVIKHKLAW